jgi:hypothetical protein
LKEFDCFFVNKFIELSHFRSNKILEVGIIMYFEAFLANTYLLKVTDITKIEDKIVIEFEKFNDLAVCNQSIPERHKRAFKQEKKGKTGYIHLFSKFLCI